MIRVLVAEDSPTVRGLLVALLHADPGIRVIAEAQNGQEAVELATRLRPDVITMDIFMPIMDGLEATRTIMMRAPTRIIIVSSATRQRDVDLAMEALRAGAVTVVGKPEYPDHPTLSTELPDLPSLVRTMAAVKVVRRWQSRIATPAVRPPADGVELIAIAASTGGPAALRQILSQLAPTFPAPILVVQHLAKGFANGFADWLHRECRLRVKVATAGERLLHGTVYTAPDDRHLGVGSGLIARVQTDPPVNGVRPSANHLFRSVAALGPRVVAVILTGMGDDGVVGLAAVRAAGGRVIAQDEGSSVVYGMPGQARAADVVDAVLPLPQIARQLSEWVR